MRVGGEEAPAFDVIIQVEFEVDPQTITVRRPFRKENVLLPHPRRKMQDELRAPPQIAQSPLSVLFHSNAPMASADNLLDTNVPLHGLKFGF